MKRQSCKAVVATVLSGVLLLTACRHQQATAPLVDIDLRVQITGLDSAIIAEAGSIYLKGFDLILTGHDGAGLPSIPASLTIAEGPGEVVVLEESSDSLGRMSALYFTILPTSECKTVISATAGNGRAEYTIKHHPLPAPAKLETAFGDPQQLPDGSYRIPLGLTVLGIEGERLAGRIVTVTTEPAVEIVSPSFTDQNGYSVAYLVIPPELGRAVELTLSVETSRIEIPEQSPAFPLMNFLPRDQQIWAVLDFFIAKKPLSTLRQKYSIRLQNNRVEVTEVSR